MMQDKNCLLNECKAGEGGCVVEDREAKYVDRHRAAIVKAGRKALLILFRGRDCEVNWKGNSLWVKSLVGNVKSTKDTFWHFD